MKTQYISLAILLSISSTTLLASPALTPKVPVEAVKEVSVEKEILTPQTVVQTVKNSGKNKKELDLTTQQSLDNSLDNRRGAYARRANKMKSITAYRDEISSKRVELNDKER